MNAKKTVEEFFLWPPPKLVERTRGVQRIPKAGMKLCAEVKKGMAKEAYELEITTKYSSLIAGSEQGLEHGRRVIDQLRKQCGDVLPCLRIVDAPDFAVRGFMLDISRGKVPSNEAWRGLVRQLAGLKYNHLQLYTEHTYAFRAHKKVWGEADPMTKEEILALQKLCKENHIELSANFNSFGHFERWLKHEEYKHLAECPKGFEHPIKGKVPHGTTLRPDETSLKFLDKLWKEYLPLFESEKFNLGGDEPWELGQGWSKPHVKKHGKQRVYLEFIKKLHKQATKHKKKVLFWADILLEAPELVDEVPEDATALLWGYEANHPFAEQCARLAKAQRKFWVCPGTSAWNTFTGRTDNMLANVESAAKEGLKNGAEGMLLTSWGDNGNHQPWPVMYPGLAYAAGLAWNQKGAKREDVARAVNVAFSQSIKSGLGETLLELGRVESGIKNPKPNRSRHFDLFFATKKQLKKELETLTQEELGRVFVAIEKAGLTYAEHAEKFLWEFGAATEIEVGGEMARWAVRRGLLAKAGKSAKELGEELPELVARFVNSWANRGREGGMIDSAQKMAEVGREL